jgi:hypothetical protein
MREHAGRREHSPIRTLGQLASEGSRRYRCRCAHRRIPALTDGVITLGVGLGDFLGNEMTPSTSYS